MTNKLFIVETLETLNKDFGLQLTNKNIAEVLDMGTFIEMGDVTYHTEKNLLMFWNKAHENTGSRITGYLKF